MNNKKLWIALAIVIGGSFLALGSVGYRMISQAPPIPSKVVTTDGRLLFDSKTIQDGQNVWQPIGGRVIGSILGHGAYVSPDWTADWLHHEALGILKAQAEAQGAPSFDSLSLDQQAVLKARLIREERTNTYDPASGVITIGAERAAVFEQLAQYYAEVFGSGRNQYAIPQGALTDPQKQRQMAAFFWWTAWRQRRTVLRVTSHIPITGRMSLW